MINIAELVTSYGSHYIPGTQQMSRLKNRLYRNQLVTESTCTVRTIDESLYRTAIVSGTEVVQSYQTPFTPKGNQTFIPNEIRLHHLKIKLTQIPLRILGWIFYRTTN
jgi:hypothetical protein